MPERSAPHRHPLSRHRTREPLWSRSDTDAPVCLTLRMESADGARTRATLEQLLRGIRDLRIMIVSHRRGVATLALHAPRGQLDAALRRIMTGVAGAEFGVIQPAARAAVH